MSLQYFAILYATTGHLQAVGAIFQSKYMFQKERSAGLYSTMVYWIVETTVHLPLLVVAYTVYINIAYWAMGLTADVVRKLKPPNHESYANTRVGRLHVHVKYVF